MTEMKTIYLLLFSSVCIFSLPIYSLHAQCTIPNSSFEQWSTIDGQLTPTGWSGIVEQTNDAQTGSFAVVLKAANLGGFPFPGIFIGEFDCNQRPGYLVFSIKTRNNSRDTLTVAAGLLNANDSVIGVAGGTNVEVRNAYTQVYVPITYRSTQTPSQALITFTVASSTSQVKIDNVSFSITPQGVLLGGFVGVNEELAQRSKKLFISPNPADDFINLEIDDPSVNEMYLTLTTIQGQVVKTFESRKGRKANVSLIDIPTGAYLLRVNTNKGLFVKRLMKD